MKLKIKKMDFATGRPVCMIHEKKAKEMSLHVGKRVLIKDKKRKIVSIVDTVEGIIKPDEIAVSNDIFEALNLKDNEIVEVELADKPNSINIIKKKLKGGILNKKEIEEIVRDIADNALTEIEVAFFVSAIYTKGMNLEETGNLTWAMVKSGNQMKLNGKIADKHSIGGIAGNRTTPLVVSICASKGLIIPKTSSRAITSAAGTTDVMETIAKVNFSINEIKKILKKTNACMVWGGALGLAPVDDKIIRIENIVHIDSTAQLLASILSKKISVGSKYVLIDIPYGISAKVSLNQAKKLKNKFMILGKKFNLKINAVLTNGNEPIGNGIGPVLEIKDVLKVLRRENPPKDLEEKALFLSGKLLELAEEAEKGKGYEVAKNILESGLAFKKFKEIIKAQKGKLNGFPKPKFSFTVHANRNLKLKHYDNKLLNRLARDAGCPEDKAAGIYLYKKKNDEVKKNEAIFTIYTVSKEKLIYAKRFFKKNQKEIIEIESR
ncbi:thymidine phosphorylase [Candidatus Pacearchaeota archaeon]|uniref:AMP phosphorylase n=1 Tax=uncultured Candidatus Pacearchaeota archaeon TaxID=2109283 RepID=A0A447IU70_9ARCH|nr:thymidine phosphorylase [Candidatus Pacearchaeota archaeon]VDS10977.1 AMP phosphorylase [uncultured Candidatus Pacearchaeota archaeon]VDS10993.1 AMP phosphorylase [uncultured Candidatus Pacearchaeota archaeon]VDS11021.1 AMP phosphorylase [uncultured Candidatus Pacearchaeota archaeon]VDS11025.1 AMP phosphorylase [uncultured Candidatus Pacearchaeota archaeon]